MKSHWFLILFLIQTAVVFFPAATYGDDFEKNLQIQELLSPAHRFGERFDPDGQDPHTTFLYSNTPPPQNFNNSPTVYTEEYAVPAPTYYFLYGEDGSTVWGKIKR